MPKLADAKDLKKQGKRQEAKNVAAAILLENITPALRTETLEFLQLLDLEDKDYASALSRADALVHDFPKEARFYNNRGIVLACSDRLTDGVASFTKALELDPNFTDASLNLAKAWLNLEQPPKAIAVLQDLVERKPYLADPYKFLGNLFEQTGRKDQAEMCFRKSSWLNPKDAAAGKKWSLMPAQILVSHFGDQASPGQAEVEKFIEELLAFGQKCTKEGKWDEARGVYERIIGFQELTPVKNLSGMHATLGEIFERQRKLDKALESFRKAVELAPKNPRFHYKLAELLGKTEKSEEAKEFIAAKLAVSPSRHDLREILGRIYITDLNAEGAHEIFADLTTRFPTVPDFQYMFQVVQSLRGDYATALAAADHMLKMYPDEIQMKFNRSLVLLGMGRFVEGWKDYETRKLQGKGEGETKSAYKKALPVWKGESLAGKRLLVCSEQGLGDIINFTRMIEGAKALGAEVVFQAAFPPHDRILPLLKSYRHLSGILPNGHKAENFDYCVDLLSLPGLLHVDLAKIPGQVPYLFAEKEREESYKKILDNLGGFKIGIAWQGNPKHARDKVRSFPLEKFQAIAEIPGVHLIKLQKNVEAKNVAFHLVDLGDHLDKDGAFLDTAAVMRNLDLVISCDSAIAHVAGSLGVPVWLALSLAPDWRWLTERTDSPWYPTMRLFRQKKLAQWDDVLGDMARALREEVLPLRFAGSVSVDVSPGELLDKISILQIKKEKIEDQDKLRNVCRELASLENVASIMPRHPELDGVFQELKETNARLWVIEDDIRLCETRNDFGELFINLARSVYKNNDHRAVLKRKINDALKARIVEEKSYSSEKS